MSESVPVGPPVQACKPWWKKWWGIALIVFGVLVVISAFTDTDTPDQSDATPDIETAQPETEQQEQPEVTPKPEPAEEPADESEPEEPLTISQRNAVRSAESYLRFTAFSRTGLISQLEFEDYETEDATFAVDFLEIDWDEQAALNAESYLEYTSFSRSGLIDQLIFEGFTRAEAEYGVTQVGY